MFMCLVFIGCLGEIKITITISRVSVLTRDKNGLILCSLVLTQYHHMMERQTDMPLIACMHCTLHSYAMLQHKSEEFFY